MLSGQPEGAPPLTPNDPTHSSVPAHSHLICVLNNLLQVLIAVVGIQTPPLLCGSPAARATPISPAWFPTSSSGLRLSMVATWLVNVTSCSCFCSYNFKVFRETSTFSEEDYFEGCQVKGTCHWALQPEFDPWNPQGKSSLTSILIPWHVHTHTDAHTHTCIHAHALTHSYTYTHIHSYAHTCLPTHIYSQSCMNTHSCAHTRIHSHSCTCVHKDLCAHVCTLMCTQCTQTCIPQITTNNCKN